MSSDTTEQNNSTDQYDSGKPSRSRRTFLRYGTGALGGLATNSLLSSPAAAAAGGRKPNIVFLLGEGQRLDAQSLTGNKIVHTPNLDRIGREGVQFQNSFCVNALCSPSRGTCLTGLYSHTTGAIDNKQRMIPKEVPLISDLLHDAGYEVAMCGKAHMKNGFRERYWDYYFAYTGAATALLAGLIAFTQFDIKKVLAYSTVSQLGFMIAAAGMGAYVAAMFHLITHAFFKASLFLGSGSVIHAMHIAYHHAGIHDKDPQDIRNMGGLSKFMPITYWTFLVATLAIAGFPIFSGFFSKDEILWKTFASGHKSLWAIGATAAKAADGKLHATISGEAYAEIEAAVMHLSTVTGQAHEAMNMKALEVGAVVHQATGGIPKSDPPSVVASLLGIG